ncbi:MAG: hypothetical protein AABX91_00865 [Nanoarchaeota archaeon]
MKYKLRFMTRMEGGRLEKAIEVETESLPRIGETIVLRRTIDQARNLPKGVETSGERNDTEIKGTVYEVIRNVHQNFSVIDTPQDPPKRVHYFDSYNDFNRLSLSKDRNPVVKVLITK